MGIESDLGCCGFSSKPTTLPAVSNSATPKRCGSDPVEQRAAAPGAGLELRGHARQGIAAQDVVAQDHAEAVLAHEVAGQADGVGDAERAALVAVGQIQAEVAAVREQLHDVADAAPAEDDHDLTDAHARQRLEREVDHGPVVDRHEVLVRHQRQRVEARPGATGQNDTLHGILPPSRCTRLARWYCPG